MILKKEGNGYFYCKNCKIKANSILTPEENGMCVYCGFNETLNVIYRKNLTQRNLTYSRYGKCKECNDDKEVVVGKKVYCLFCKKAKGRFYG